MRYLLDVNVLLALAWEDHVHHKLALNWFLRKRVSGFSTCPMTQAAFVRISSNPHFTPDALTLPQALELLDTITTLAKHEFWPDDLTLRQAIPPHLNLRGHQQLTDTYLIGLAVSHGGRVATLDRAMRSTADDRQESVELLI